MKIKATQNPIPKTKTTEPSKTSMEHKQSINIHNDDISSPTNNLTHSKTLMSQSNISPEIAINNLKKHKHRSLHFFYTNTIWYKWCPFNKYAIFWGSPLFLDGPAGILDGPSKIPTGPSKIRFEFWTARPKFKFFISGIFFEYFLNIFWNIFF